MALLLKPPSWGRYVDNFTGTPSNTPGTAVTAGASNADGSTGTLLTAVPFDVEMMMFGFLNYNTTGTNTATLIDILVDPAGGTTWDTTNPLINDLLAGQSATVTGLVGIPMWYHFPLWYKSGASFGARARNASGSTVAGRVVMIAKGGNGNPGSYWCGQSVESIGITAASSTGTAHTPGNSGSFSSWANIGSTQVGNGGAVQFGVHSAQSTLTAIQYYFQFGIASTQIGPTIHRICTTAEQGSNSQTGPIWYASPNGTQWMARATASGTAVAHAVAIYVVH